MYLGENTRRGYSVRDGGAIQKKLSPLTTPMLMPSTASVVATKGGEELITEPHRLLER